MIGKVAKCQKGITGLILSVRKAGRFRIGKLLYKGVCLDPGRVGQPWQSTHPEWIETLDEWIKHRYAEIMEAE